MTFTPAVLPLAGRLVMASFGWSWTPWGHSLPSDVGVLSTGPAAVARPFPHASFVVDMEWTINGCNLAFSALMLTAPHPAIGAANKRCTSPAAPLLFVAGAGQPLSGNPSGIGTHRVRGLVRDTRTSNGRCSASFGASCTV